MIARSVSIVSVMKAVKKGGRSLSALAIVLMGFKCVDGFE